MQKNTQNDQDFFMIFNEKLSKKGFPNIYEIYKNDPKWAETQVLSIANAWHEGRIGPAAIALEMDLAHM